MTEEPRITISELIKRERKRQKFTQVKLANYAGVGLRFLRDLEQGKPTVRMDKVNQVLILFGYEVGPVPMDRKKIIREDS